jgi:hypothetical protein
MFIITIETRESIEGFAARAPRAEALLSFDVELAPGAQHPVWARITAENRYRAARTGGKTVEGMPRFG